MKFDSLYFRGRKKKSHRLYLRYDLLAVVDLLIADIIYSITFIFLFNFVHIQNSTDNKTISTRKFQNKY